MIIRYDRWMNSLMSEMLLMSENDCLHRWFEDVVLCITILNKMISSSQDQVMHTDFNNIDKSLHWIKTVKLINC